MPKPSAKLREVALSPQNKYTCPVARFTRTGVVIRDDFGGRARIPYRNWRHMLKLARSGELNP